MCSHNVSIAPAPWNCKRFNREARVSILKKRGSEPVWGVAETTQLGGNRRTWATDSLQDSSPRYSPDGRGVVRLGDWGFSGRDAWLPSSLDWFWAWVAPRTSPLVLAAVTGVAFKAAMPESTWEGLLCTAEAEAASRGPSCRYQAGQDLEESWVGHSEGPQSPLCPHLSPRSHVRGPSHCEQWHADGRGWCLPGPKSARQLLGPGAVPGAARAHGCQRHGHCLTVLWLTAWHQAQTTSCGEAGAPSVRPRVWGWALLHSRWWVVAPALAQRQRAGTRTSLGGHCGETQDPASLPRSGLRAVAQRSQLDAGGLRRQKRGVHDRGVLVANGSTRLFPSRIHPPPCRAQPRSLLLSCLHVATSRGHTRPRPQKPEVAASLERAGVSTPEVGSPVGVLWRGPFPALGGIPRWGERRALQGLGATWASAFLPRTTVEWGTSRRCGPSPGAAAGVTGKNAGMQDKVQPARERWKVSAILCKIF